MSEPKRLTVPLSPEDARALKLDDLVVLDGEIIVTAGLPTIERIVEYHHAGKALPFDLKGAAFFHIGSYSRGAGDSFEVLYMNPTTSTRFNPFMPELIRSYGLTSVGGKGGLDAESTRAMQEIGCVYLSFLGGGAPLHSHAIKEVLAVGWEDFVSHYRLVKLRVEGLGPLTVAIDAHGNNAYENLKASASERLPEILAEMDREREASKAGG